MPPNSWGTPLNPQRIPRPVGMDEWAASRERTNDRDGDHLAERFATWRMSPLEVLGDGFLNCRSLSVHAITFGHWLLDLAVAERQSRADREKEAARTAFRLVTNTRPTEVDL